MNQSFMRRETGMSLVEIMVGMVIGMITVLAIMQVLAGSEGQRRTTGGGADSLTSAATALYLVERQVRMGGHGISLTPNGVLDVCGTQGIRYYYQPPSTGPGAPPPAIEGTFSLFGPVDIITNPDATISDASSHMLRISYGESTEMGNNGVAFTQPAASSANYRVENRSGFRTGDLVLAVEPGQPCTLAEITGLPASGQCGAGGGAGQTDVVIHNSGNYASVARSCQNVPSAWNKPAGLGVSYTTDARLYNFGERGFISTQFAVRNQRLMTCSTLGAAASDCTVAANWTPLVDQVVALQARYGIDTNNDGQIDSWSLALCDDSGGACTPTFAERMQVLAIRLAVVSRSPQFERNQVTAVAPQWLTDESLDAEPVSFDLTHLANWQQYRYRVMETTIPLRNVIWAR